jgi:plasmid stability protein
VSDSLLDLAVRVRQQTNRPLDERGREHLRRKIAMLTASEQAEARATLRNLLSAVAKVPTPNRKRP